MCSISKRKISKKCLIHFCQGQKLLISIQVTATGLEVNLLTLSIYSLAYACQYVYKYDKH